MSARRSNSNVFGSSSGTSSMSGRVPVDCSIRSSAISITSRLRRPRKSIFSRPRSSTPCISYCVTIGASSMACPGFRLALDREVLGERLAGDHDRGRVDAVLAAQPFEPPRHVDHAPRVGIVVVQRPQLGRHLVAVGVLVGLLEARVQRRVAAHDERRHELGDLVADDVRVAEHARGVAHRGPRLDRRERDDLRDVVVAVLLRGVADHLAAVARVEVHVDVGHLLAARVQEPLEQQVVLDRVDVDDAQAVRDARTRRAPPPRADADAARLRVPHEVPDHEEVRGEPHRLDHVELVLDAFDARAR